ncbi:dihydrodipicolinate synthase family protein [Spiractinospora alimapuensis]|uniref:dihydrodipicolinate synthase family protein n=1 Tax=Spiractinospora alimapuensis TaxID=2820884 RepID=UPI001F266425|nr:dihydrodipicolinate synthase family protein [Spiractinospora alimapuensis]QVQ54719.1 dihydrodipicolinate synthase family protein [Spiractinospora alimapuensis]
MPQLDGTLADHWLRDGHEESGGYSAAPPRSRVAYAATHVVADPLAGNAPGEPARLDWDATLAFRRHLWRLGLGVAEAMDTAQRGMGLDWACTAELIRRSAEEARSVGGAIVCGAGTDHAEPRLNHVDDVAGAYETQLEVVEGAGVTPVLMASRQLAALATGPEDYARVYGRILGQVRAPVVLHWLGPDFDPALAGYWGEDDPAKAIDGVVALVTEHVHAVDGIKVSLLDADLEIRLRERLPAGVRLYTGDDFNYPELIKGSRGHHSDALLGVFAAIAPAAVTALHALDVDDLAAYDAAFEPTLPLARHLFAAPTFYYKTGIAFLAWLNGHQPGFTMVGGLQSARSLPHLCHTVRLADEAGVLEDPPLAAHRTRSLLETAGVEQ